MRVAALVALAYAACIPPRTAWIPAERPFVAARAGFEVTPPPGWMRRNFEPDRNLELVVVTRDGSSLQQITVGVTEVGKTISPRSKRAVAAGMSPQELSELMVDDVRASNTISDLRTLEMTPASLSGRSGFRVVFAYRDRDGLPIRLAAYGLQDGTRFYMLVYRAPERHYFALDLPAFDEVVRSFRIRGAAPPAAAAPGAPTS